MKDGMLASLGCIGGALGARILDEAMPDTVLYSHTFGQGRRAQIRPSAALGIVAVGLGLAGIKVPGGALALGIGAGMLGYEATMEYGDDVAAMVLGLDAPAGQPAPALPPAAPAPGPAASLASPYGWSAPAANVPDPYLNAAMAGLGQQFPAYPPGYPAGG